MSKSKLMIAFLFSSALVSSAVANMQEPSWLFLSLETEDNGVHVAPTEQSLQGYTILTRNPWVELYSWAQPLNTSIIIQAFDSTAEDPSWNPNLDLYSDGEINILDALVLAYYFEEWS